MFIQIVNKAVMKSGDTFSLQLVQTKLVLALLAFSQDQYNQAWDLCGSAVRVAFGLRYHTEEGVSAIQGHYGSEFGLNHGTLVECRRRTFWSAYVMNCFSSSCAASVTAVSRSDCHLRLPCAQETYETGNIPLTPFNLDLSTNNREHEYTLRQGLSEVGLLGYLVEIATIYNEVVSRISGSKPQAAAKDHLPTEMSRQDIMSRLNAWDNLTKRYLHQSRDEGELIGGLHVLYHHSAMILHRTFDIRKSTSCQLASMLGARMTTLG
jgi:hypothetical protein